MHSGCIGAGELADLASRGVRRSTDLRVASLDRLALELVAGPETEAACIHARLGFQQGAEGFPELEIGLVGTLQLECQRCLLPAAWVLDLSVRLTVVEREAQLEHISAPMDSIVLEQGRLDLERVIEDEVLAALPMIPMHTGPGCPAMADPTGAGAGETATTRPFAGLDALLGRGVGRQDDS